jgi:hypothetical protein
MEEIRDNSPPTSVKTGFLLVKIGFVIALAIPVIMLLLLGNMFGGQAVFTFPIPDFFLAIMVWFIAVGWGLSFLALKFGNDVVNSGLKHKADYVLILGIVVFIFGSNLAGILIAIGGYLMRKKD